MTYLPLIKNWINTNIAKPAFILRVVAFFWLVQKILSWKLWVTERMLPTIPAFDVLQQIPGIVHWVLFAIAIFLLLFLLNWPETKAAQITLLIVEILSCSLDQIRWQPWEYQYLCMFFIVIINSKEKVLPMFLFMAACLYFYSGLHKFNPQFLPQIWQKMILQDFCKLNISFIQQPIIYYCGYGIAAIELLGGVGLLIKKTRKITAVILIGLHIVVLILLGPWGLNYNLIIWPWNIAMILFLLIFIVGNPYIFYSWKTVFYKWNKLVFISWGLLPILCIWGYWDGFFSFNVYSGSEPKVFICVTDSSKLIIPTTSYINDTQNKCNGQAMVSLQRWAMKEMNVPVIPQIRVYKRIEADFKKKHPNAGAVFLYY